jgi:hypothetical protein
MLHPLVYSDQTARSLRLWMERLTVSTREIVGASILGEVCKGMALSSFVLTKPGVEAGERLADIVARKEAERLAGNGTFWWGAGSSLGPAIRDAAEAAGGRLPVLFLVHEKPTAPRVQDVSPSSTFRWTEWQDRDGNLSAVPAFARVTSRGDENKRTHYALVCYSETPIIFDPNGPLFDPRQCKTAKGKPPGSSQVTALLRGDLGELQHRNGQYRVVFRATMVSPWQAKLVTYQKI